VKRALRDSEGRLVSYNQGEGWRVAYLVKICGGRADIQPIGPIGKVPGILTVSLANLRPELCQSATCPTVQEYYRANDKKKVVLLVAKPTIEYPPMTSAERAVLTPAIKKLSVELLPAPPPALVIADTFSKHNVRPFTAAVVQEVNATKSNKDAEVYATRNANSKLSWTAIDLQLFGKKTHGNISWAAYKREKARVEEK